MVCNVSVHYTSNKTCLCLVGDCTSAQMMGLSQCFHLWFFLLFFLLPQHDGYWPLTPVDDASAFKREFQPPSWFDIGSGCQSLLSLKGSTSNIWLYYPALPPTQLGQLLVCTPLAKLSSYPSLKTVTRAFCLCRVSLPYPWKRKETRCSHPYAPGPNKNIC